MSFALYSFPEIQGRVSFMITFVIHISAKRQSITLIDLDRV